MCALLQLGQVEVQRDSGSGDAETREQLIKNHFTQRINDMTLQLQLADSKAVNFHAEVSLPPPPLPPGFFFPSFLCMHTHACTQHNTTHTDNTYTHTQKTKHPVLLYVMHTEQNQ